MAQFELLVGLDSSLLLNLITGGIQTFLSHIGNTLVGDYCQSFRCF